MGLLNLSSGSRRFQASAGCYVAPHMIKGRFLARSEASRLEHGLVSGVVLHSSRMEHRRGLLERELPSAAPCASPITPGLTPVSRRLPDLIGSIFETQPTSI